MLNTIFKLKKYSITLVLRKNFAYLIYVDFFPHTKIGRISNCKE